MSLEEKGASLTSESGDIMDGRVEPVAPVNPKVLRRLLLKMDFILLPTLALTYIFKYVLLQRMLLLLANIK